MGQMATIQREQQNIVCSTLAQNLDEGAKKLAMVRHAIDSSQLYDGMGGSKRIADAIPEAKRIIASGEYDALVRDLLDAAKPATKQQIGAALSQMVAAFPNAARADLSAFGAVLAIDIASMRPTAYAIESACRKLRQTLKFVPTICEVMEAIKDQERLLNAYAWAIERFPEAVLNAERVMSEYEREAEARKQQAIQSNAKRNEGGDPLS